MHTTGRSFRGVVTALLSRPDGIMLEVGAGGELLVARLRAVGAAALLLPLANALGGGSIGKTLIGLGAAVAANILAQVWLALSRRRRQLRWLPLATCAFDVTATSVVLLLLAINQLPACLNSLADLQRRTGQLSTRRRLPVAPAAPRQRPPAAGQARRAQPHHRARRLSGATTVAAKAPLAAASRHALVCAHSDAAGTRRRGITRWMQWHGWLLACSAWRC